MTSPTMPAEQKGDDNLANSMIPPAMPPTMMVPTGVLQAGAPVTVVDATVTGDVVFTVESEVVETLSS